MRQVLMLVILSTLLLLGVVKRAKGARTDKKGFYLRAAPSLRLERLFDAPPHFYLII
jgi:hypothetical protein